MLEILCESHFGRGWGCYFLCQRNHGLMRWDAKSRASFNLFVYRKGFNTILRSQFQLLSVKRHRQAQAQIDHFLGSEARLQKRNNHGFSSEYGIYPLHPPPTRTDIKAHSFFNAAFAAPSLGFYSLALKLSTYYSVILTWVPTSTACRMNMYSLL